MAIKSVVLIIILVAIAPIIPINNAYAEPVDCNGHAIERGDFDSDGDDEVKVDGTVYEDGDSILLDGITYTTMIGSGSITGTNGNDFIVGSNGDDSIFGEYFVDYLNYGYSPTPDFIVGLDGDDGIKGDDVLLSGLGPFRIFGGDDIICGNDGDDLIYGDYITDEEGASNVIAVGGNDEIFGGEGDDYIIGDDIGIGQEAYPAINNILIGGNDIIDGGEGDDEIYGESLYDETGNILIAGNDIIDTRDGTINNDKIYGDYFDVYTARLLVNGTDICISDPDNEVDCEDDYLLKLIKFNPNNNLINPGDDVLLEVDINAIPGPLSGVTITNVTVTTPLGIICSYDDVLYEVPIGAGASFRYPDEFNDNPDCNTDTAGVYQAELETEIGDPIIVTFSTSFRVLNESVIGALGLVGVSIVVFMLYRRQKTY